MVIKYEKNNFKTWIGQPFTQNHYFGFELFILKIKYQSGKLPKKNLLKKMK